MPAFTSHNGYGSKGQVVGFTASRILSVSAQESQLNLSNNGPKDGQGPSNSYTISMLAARSWQSDKILSMKKLAKTGDF